MISTTQTWVLSEHSGRWTAAMRIAIARRSRGQFVPRLYEVQSLADVAAYVAEHRGGLGLVEVGRANLAEVLELIAGSRSRPMGRFVALLDHSLDGHPPVGTTSQEPDQQSVAEALWEAGAAEVLESPRRLDRLMTLGQRFASLTRQAAANAAEGQSIADWAWSTLPWQEP